MSEINQNHVMFNITDIPKENEINNVLKQRGKIYGSYAKNAKLSQKLKDIIRDDISHTYIPYEQREALDNILQKIARIINGDTFYEDNWIDIIGYSQLALDAIREAKLRQPVFSTKNYGTKND